MSLFNNLNPIELGERLRLARNNVGLTQELAAETIQVKRPTLVAIEQGKRRVKPEELTELANLYQISCGSLLRPEVAWCVQPSSAWDAPYDSNGINVFS